MLSSCRDELWNDIFENGGDCITLDLDFMPASSSELQTRGSLWSMPGGGMSNIRDICLVIFDENGRYEDLIDISDSHYEENKNYDRTEEDTSNGQPTSELTSIRRKYRLDLPTGNFYVYAVANLGEYTDAAITKSTYSVLVDEMKVKSMTREEFRAYRTVWNPSNYRCNSEMTGICTVGSLPGNAVFTGDTDTDSPIYLRPGLQLHCWLRRLASKVTVDFDATNLNPSTTIYLKEIRVRDIPYDCSLFNKNSPSHYSIGNHTVPVDSPYGLMSNSRSVHGIRLCGDAYTQENNEETDHKNWPFLTAGIPTLKDLVKAFDTDVTIPSAVTARRDVLNTINHSNSAPCLYFYENMQGRDESKPKAADADNDGIIDSPDSYLSTDENYKDQVPGGSYVEVIAYYQSLEKGNEGEGNIIYRFMLGKDIVCDYNAERNYHFKLTLCFNGYANDVDWHIEYDRDKPPYSIPDEYYISYGYNESMEFPVTVSGELKDGIITAEIVRNDWQPSQMWMDVHPPTYANGVDTFTPYPNGNIPYPDGDINKVSLGFLSLRKPQNDVIGATKTASSGDSHAYILKAWKGEALDDGDKSRNRYTDHNVLYNTNHYNVANYQTLYAGRRSLGYRVYQFTGMDENTPTGDIYYDERVRPEYAETEDGGFHVHTIKSESKILPRTSTFYIPMYTRERNICTKTGYTGENPYVNYQRRAQVILRFTVVDRKNRETVCVKRVNIIQVAKIGNPLGIWRDWNNAAPFDIQLRYFQEDGLTYSDLTSHEGGWSAEVEQGADWILLNGGRKKVTGKKGENIHFTYRPVGILSNSRQVRCGIITVRYHNYACIHKIFVRQGYAPLRMSPESPAFHTFNLVTSTSEAKNPCDEGSMFRSGNLAYPIDAINNINDAPNWARVTPGMFKDHKNTDLYIAGRYINGKQVTKKWDEIQSIGHYPGYVWDDITINGKTSRLMSIQDILFLRDGYDGNTERMRYQYGVLYSDKATKTAGSQSEAFHYKQADPNSHSYGMRGCFVYNNIDGRQIFFPIGSSGYGVRKAERKTVVAPNEMKWSADPLEIGTAVVRYAAGRMSYSNAPAYTPLLWDIFRAEGANYWAKQTYDDASKGTSGKNRSALDLNFKTFDFSALGEEMFFGDKFDPGHGSDACFIRLVDD